MLKCVFLLVLFAMLSCSSDSPIVVANGSDFHPTSTANLSIPPQTTVIHGCDYSEPSLSEKLKSLFNGLGFEPEIDQDQAFIEEVKACPRAEIIRLLLVLRDRNADNVEMKVKASFLLVKLGYETRENGKVLVSGYFTTHKEYLKRLKDPKYEENVLNNKYGDRLAGVEILYLLYRVIIENDDEIMADAFDLALITDGAASELLSEICGHQFDRNPEVFLRQLKPKSRKIKKQIYFFLIFIMGKDKLINLAQQVEKSSAQYDIANELIIFAKNSKDNA